MFQHTVKASADIAAPAERLHAVVADYREGHPRILPKPLFASLDVEQGGTGAGTVIRVVMEIAQRRKTFRAAVTEPDAGRILVETDLDGGPVTTFTFETLEAARTRVTISTRLQRRGKPIGMVERWLTSRFLRKVYAEELRLLAGVATETAESAESAEEAVQAETGD